MTQKAFLGAGSVSLLTAELDALGAKRVLLVTGNDSWRTSGAEAMTREALKPYLVHRFSDFATNPKIRDVQRGVVTGKAHPFDVVLAVGGGSAIDMGKMIALFSVNRGSIEDFLGGANDLLAAPRPIIAIPTTAGTGSEATHFAVIYIDKTKYSAAHQTILPTVAIVDPMLSSTLPARLTASTGMDALAQAIESYWSVNCTPASRQLAAGAIRLAVENLERSVHAPTDASRHAMAAAANLAGRAINLTKTTAAHALSYTLTSFYGVLHGHAVALTLGEVLLLNSEVDDESVCDSRGALFVREGIMEINRLLGTRSAGESRRWLRRLLENLGLETTLTALGIPLAEACENLQRHVDLERLKNNPRALCTADIQTIVNRIAT